MALVLLHPEIPTCAECQQFVFDKSWRKNTRRAIENGQVIEVPMPRAPGSPTPCWQCPKSKDGTPHPEKEADAKTWKAYRFYLAVKAGAPCPDDPIVFRNLSLFRSVDESVERQRQIRSDPARLIAGLIQAQAGLR